MEDHCDGGGELGDGCGDSGWVSFWQKPFASPLSSRDDFFVTTDVDFATDWVNRLMHLVLFATRARMSYQSHFWRRPWKLPEGQITFEVSVKMFRKPERRVARQERPEQESLV